MNHTRKVFAAVAFPLAFAAAIGLTAFLQLRARRADAPAPPVHSQPAAAAPVAPHRVEQAIVDFARKRNVIVLTLERNADGQLPARVWVWVDYYAPEIDDGEIRSWTSVPVEIEVTDRRLEIVAACEFCDERLAGKATYYARVHVATAPPERATLEGARAKFNLADAVPVVVQGADRKALRK